MPNCKPQKALQLGLNVLIDEGCEGCYWHEFPYEIKQNIVSNDARKTVIFNDTNDVWDYMKLLQEESIEHQKKGNSFSVLGCIWEQLPFFVCNNKILNDEYQNDIRKFVYTNKTSTPAYSGCYGDTPSVWIQKYNIIERSLMLRDKYLKKKAQDGNK